ncbi:MAG: helix-turn-helix domain-containing protein [Chloroflexota bacterium]|nr:helix-turn-helix domain-containing protein [Chloroflexota bacterium]
MDFGTRLRSWRLDAGLSQRELARRAALNFSYLSKIEAGLVAPPVEDKIRALAAALSRGEDDAELLLRLARESRVPSDVVKAALIRNPGVGALLRRIQDRRLTEQELAALLEVVEDRPSPDRGSNS